MSPQLIDHFQNPRNAGSLDSADVLTIETANPVCGDILRLSVRLEDGRVAEVRYRTRGCTAAIACGSALTERMQGRTRDEIAAIRAADIEEAVGGLPPASKHAALLCEDAVKALLGLL